MKLKTFALSAALALATVGCASTGAATGMLAPDAPRALAAQGPVSVSWGDPAKFTEITGSGNRFEAERGDWLNKLAVYLRDQSEKALPAGNTLSLTIVDIKRAGQYEPWYGIERQNIRMIRDIYPPRMTLQFRELDASGNVVAEGERKLTDPAFLLNSTPLNDTDPLRYEKRMIDSWVRREFNSRTAAR